MELSTISEELINALGRLPGEREKAWLALIDYAQMEKRSLAGLVNQYRSSTEAAPTKQLTRIKQWSKRFAWQTRVAQWDLVLADDKVQEWARRKEKLNELDWDQGLELRTLALAMARKALVVGDLRLAIAGWAETDKVQRLAVDAPTSNVNLLSGASLDAGLIAELSRLGYSQQASAVGPAQGDADAGPETTKGPDSLAPTTQAG